MTTTAQANLITTLTAQLRENLTNVTTSQRAEQAARMLNRRDVATATCTAHGAESPIALRATLGDDRYEIARDEVEAHLVAARLARTEHLATLTPADVDTLDTREASALIDELLIDELKANPW